AKGRLATAWFCARRSLAAETISIALVICFMFLTLEMRRLMSRIDSPAIVAYTTLLRQEALVKLLDGRLQGTDDVLCQLLLPGVRRQDLRLLLVEEAQVLALPLLHPLGRHRVEEPVDAGVNHGDLALDGHGLVLTLL